MRIALKLLTSCAVISTANLTHAADAPFVDLAVRDLLAASEYEPQRPLSHVQPTRIELPQTQTPLAAQARSADAMDLIVQLLGSFGECPADLFCPADVNGDGIVDVLDLLALMNQLFDAQHTLRSERLEVGYVLPTPDNFIHDAVWRDTNDPDVPGALATRIELQSENAQGLRVQIAGLRSAPIGAELRIYDPNGHTILDVVSIAHESDAGGWWSPIIFGDAIGIELLLPHSAVERPTITNIAYLHCGMECHNGPGSALACNIDVTCHSTWSNNEARAVGAMGYVGGSSCFVCTGALINRTAEDFVPLFLTANHCISTFAEAASLEIRWLYQTAACNGSAPSFNGVPRTNGATLLKRHSGSDITLLGLLQPPGTDTYLAWSAAGWTSGEDATGVHHPNGSWKRIAFGASGLTGNVNFCDGSGQNCFVASTRNVNYTDGTTQGGSSGSPVFDPQRRVRGTLTGGAVGCPNPSIAKYYGRLDLAYANLRYYIDDVSSPTVFVNGSIVGDATGDGNNERGTAANPFNTLIEALFAVRSGDEIRMTPANYNEPMTIDRPMKITRNGASGIVRIGVP